MIQKQKKISKLNVWISLITLAIAFVYFGIFGYPSKPKESLPATAMTANDTHGSSPAPSVNNKVLSIADQAPSATSPSSQAKAAGQNPAAIPEDVSEQLNTEPAETPPDITPPDIKAQLDQAQPELPEDIKRAIATPARIVSLDEVNTPPDNGQ